MIVSVCHFFFLLFSLIFNQCFFFEQRFCRQIDQKNERKHYHHWRNNIYVSWILGAIAAEWRKTASAYEKDASDNSCSIQWLYFLAYLSLWGKKKKKEKRRKKNSINKGCSEMMYFYCCCYFVLRLKNLASVFLSFVFLLWTLD